MNSTTTTQEPSKAAPHPGKELLEAALAAYEAGHIYQARRLAERAKAARLRASS